ncbi:MAG: hypothetical protein ACK5JT_14890 [Hyphomicrobiaceae bacterium]
MKRFVLLLILAMPTAGFSGEIQKGGDGERVISRDFPVIDYGVTPQDKPNYKNSFECDWPVEYRDLDHTLNPQNAITPPTTKPTFTEKKQALAVKRIYFYLGRVKMLETKDCSCAGRWADMKAALAIYDRLYDTTDDPMIIGSSSHKFDEQSQALDKQIKIMCGQKY